MPVDINDTATSTIQSFVILTSLAEFTSGVILITSVLKIRRYMLANSDTEHGIDVKTLTLHTLAFGLFIASITIYTTAYVVYLGHPDYNHIMDTTAITQMAVYGVSFIS